MWMQGISCCDGQVRHEQQPFAAQGLQALRAQVLDGPGAGESYF